MLTPLVRVAWAASYTLGMSQRAMLEKALGASDDRVRDLTKQWAEGLSARMGITVRSHGMTGIDWSAPCVVMANHQSYLDVLALYRALPRPFGVVAKSELFAVPFFSGVMRALGCVAVDRASAADAIGALRDAARSVREGSTLAVFPEGTRSRGDRIGPLKKGAFHLTQLARVPVVPIGIRGSAALMPKRNTAIHPGVIEVHAGPPIPPIGPDAAERRALLARVRGELSRLSGLPAVD